MSLLDLPCDVINIITENLSVKDIISFRSVCHNFHELCRCYDKLPQRKEEWFYGKIVRIYKCLSNDAQKRIDTAETVTDLFIDMCMNGQLDGAKLLLSHSDPIVKNPKKMDEEKELEIRMRIHLCNSEMCKKACLEMLENYNPSHVRIHAFDNDAFKFACSRGHLEVAKWLNSFGGFNISVIGNSIFRCTCMNGHLDVAKWLVDLGVNIHADNDNAFSCACSFGHLELAKWLVSLPSNSSAVTNSKEFVPSYGLGNVNIHAKNEHAFIFTCFGGHIDVAKWLYELGNNTSRIDIHADNDEALSNACTQGHFELAKWLYSLDSSNFKLNNVFCSTCWSGHLEIAKWLYSTGNVDIHTENDWSFRMSCENGKLEVAKWLYGLGRIKCNCNETFVTVCREGHLEVAKWLFSLGRVNIHSNNDEAFRLTNNQWKRNISTWLQSLKPNYKFPEN